MIQLCTIFLLSVHPKTMAGSTKAFTIKTKFYSSLAKLHLIKILYTSRFNYLDFLSMPHSRIIFVMNLKIWTVLLHLYPYSYLKMKFYSVRQTSWLSSSSYCRNDLRLLPSCKISSLLTTIIYSKAKGIYLLPFSCLIFLFIFLFLLYFIKMIFFIFPLPNPLSCDLLANVHRTKMNKNKSLSLFFKSS